MPHVCTGRHHVSNRAETLQTPFCQPLGHGCRQNSIGTNHVIVARLGRFAAYPSLVQPSYVRIPTDRPTVLGLGRVWELGYCSAATCDHSLELLESRSWHTRRVSTLSRFPALPSCRRRLTCVHSAHCLQRIYNRSLRSRRHHVQATFAYTIRSAASVPHTSLCLSNMKAAIRHSTRSAVPVLSILTREE
jgi:hypothetical protein